MGKLLILDFFKNCPIIEYEKGEKIQRPSENSEFTFLVKSGYIRMYKILNSGQEITISWYNPRKQELMIFGISDVLNSYYIEAVTDVAIYRAPRSGLYQLIKKEPSTMTFIAADSKVVLEELLAQIEWLAIPDAYTRIKAVLYSLARRIGIQKKDHIMLENTFELELKITHHLIATFAGLSRETVTIQMNHLLHDGYIKKDGGNLIITDIEKLKAEIS